MAYYPPWWETTVTIYNKFEDRLTHNVTWYRHVVKGTFWKNTRNKVTIGEVTIDANTVICRIRQDKKYLEPHEWIEIPNDEMEEYYTLGRGDIIVKGEVEDIVDENLKGHRSSDLLSKYKMLQGCMEIEDVSINTGTARNEPHYFVSGT